MSMDSFRFIEQRHGLNESMKKIVNRSFAMHSQPRYGLPTVVPCAFVSTAVLTAYITISCMCQFINMRLAKHGIRHILD